MTFEKINDDIQRLIHTEEPLSADSFLIQEDGENYVFDVGANPDYIPSLDSLTPLPTIIISHFHPDHCLNLPQIHSKIIYVSKETEKHYHLGKIVADEIELNKDIVIGNIPSSHSKTALFMRYKSYLFVGDALCSGNRKYNVQKLAELIRFLKTDVTDKIVIYHEDNPIHPKAEIIEKLEKIYSLRENDNPYIFDSHYFY